MNRLLVLVGTCLLYLSVTVNAQSYLPSTGGTLSGPLNIQYPSSIEYIIQHLDPDNHMIFGFKRGSSVDGNDLLIRAWSGIALSGNNSENIGFYMQPGGNVGIGTVAPNGKLTVTDNQVYNQETGVLALETSDPNKRMYFGFDVNLNAGYIQAQIKGTSAEPILLNAMGGNVGIGTTDTKGYKLAVAGNVVAEQLVIKLQANWPDYVFDDSSYHLKPLSQVEQYIKDNKHLPEIPSAAEVTKKGLDVGDNQALLLKKVEELTLYIINQQKQIDALTKEVSALKKQ